MALVLAVAGGLRFRDLAHAAVRSDEINFLNYVARDQSLVELWKTPPWFNQIPLADSLPIAWARLTNRRPNRWVRAIRRTSPLANPMR